MNFKKGVAVMLFAINTCMTFYVSYLLYCRAKVFKRGNLKFNLVVIEMPSKELIKML